MTVLCLSTLWLTSSSLAKDHTIGQRFWLLGAFVARRASLMLGNSNMGGTCLTNSSGSTLPTPVVNDGPADESVHSEVETWDL